MRARRTTTRGKRTESRRGGGRTDGRSSRRDRDVEVRRSAGDAETEAALVAATRNKKNAERELQDTTQALMRANREEDDQSRGLDNLRAQMDALTKTMTDAMNSLEAVRAKKLQLKQAQAALEQQVAASNSAIESALQRAEAAAAAATAAAAAAAAAAPVKQESAVLLGDGDGDAAAGPAMVAAAPTSVASDIMDMFAPAASAPAPTPTPVPAASMTLTSDAGGSSGGPRYYWTRRYGGGDRSQNAGGAGLKKDEKISLGAAPGVVDARMLSLRFGGRSLEAATRAQERKLATAQKKRMNK